MKLFEYPDRSLWQELIVRPVAKGVDLRSVCEPIFANIKQQGDSAVKEYCLQFDKVELVDLQVSEEEFAKAEQLTAHANSIKVRFEK